MDLARHIDVFDPSKIPGTVAVVGCGALGSAVALQLAKLGIKNIVLIDGDVVENHNLPNQVLFGPTDVGHRKAQTLASRLAELTGSYDAKGFSTFIPNAQMLTDRGLLDQYDVRALFVCVDSMAARRKIYTDCVQRNFRLAYYAEGRVGSREGHVSAFHPSLAHSRAYLAALYGDDEVTPDVGSCGNSLMIGATAMTIACQLVWHFMQAYPARGEGVTPWEVLDLRVSNLEVYYKGHYVAPKAAQAA